MVVYHLQKRPGKSGWKLEVDGTRLLGSFQWKIFGSNGKPERVVLFFQKECSKRKSVFHFIKAIFVTSLRPSWPLLGLICTLVNAIPGRRKFTSSKFCVPFTQTVNRATFETPHYGT